MSAAIKKSCVQCIRTYTDADNGDGTSCVFHTHPYDSWKKGYGCCAGTPQGCQRKPHRDAHHCEYPYEAFFKRSSEILNYVDTVDVWCSMEENDLGGGASEKVMVGQLLRWKSKGQYIKDQNLLVVRIGSSVWAGSPYFFHVFNEKELDEIGKKGKKEIYRSHLGSDKYSAAEWILKDALVIGIRCETKVASNERASISDVMFTAFPLTKGVVNKIQSGALSEFKPATPYVLPANASNTPDAPDLAKLAAAQREANSDFKTYDAITKKGQFSIELGAPLLCNQNNNIEGFDCFSFHLVLANASSNTIMLSKIKCEAKQLNGKEWFPLPDSSFDFGRFSPMPLTLPATSSADIVGVLRVPHTFGGNVAKCEDKYKGNWYRSYIARHKPLRLRFSFLATDQTIASRVTEYVQKIGKPGTLAVRDANDLAFVALDDIEHIERVSAMITERTDNALVAIDGNDFSVVDAKKIVFQAIKDKKSEIPLDSFAKTTDNIERKVWALVDLDCQTVYAIKLMLTHTASAQASVAYARVRFYGDSSAAAKPVRPAIEGVLLPKLIKPLLKYDFNDVDEKIDDLTEKDLKFDLPAESSSSSSGGGGGGGGNVDLSRIEAQLTTLNVARIAAALEALAANRK